MRTLEAWGAMIENDHRAYYTAGGRIWVMDLEPVRRQEAAAAWDWIRLKQRRVRSRLPPHFADRRHAGDRRVADVLAA